QLHPTGQALESASVYSFEVDIEGRMCQSGARGITEVDPIQECLLRRSARIEDVQVHAILQISRFIIQESGWHCVKPILDAVCDDRPARLGDTSAHGEYGRDDVRIAVRNPGVAEYRL